MRPGAMADTAATSGRPRICLTGATGYVDGWLPGVLQRSGCRVCRVARRPGNLRGRLPETNEVARGDLLDRASLAKAMGGQDVGLYLVGLYLVPAYLVPAYLVRRQDDGSCSAEIATLRSQ